MATFNLTIAEGAVAGAHGSQQVKAVEVMRESAHAGLFPHDGNGYQLVHGRFAEMRESAHTRTSTSFRTNFLRVVKERARVTPVFQPFTTYHLTLPTQHIAVRLRTTVGLTATLISHLVAHDHVKAGYGVTLREKARARDRMLGQAAYAVALRSTVRVGAIAKLGVGVAMRETLRAASTFTATARAIVKVQERLVAGDTLERHLVALAVMPEGVEVDDRTALRMLYRQQVHERCYLALGLYDIAGDCTTWAVNARTGAVTEYGNYDFTSFARTADGRYIGTGPQGLYVLDGPDDAGEAVIADMVSGLLEMTGTNLTGLRAVYLGVRGQGDFFLKLVADESRATTYRVTAQSLHTARINVGKGWRARFFQYQLVSTGQDFDLQGIEFLPITSTRRI